MTLEPISQVDWMPGINEVAAFIPARAIDSNGRRLGTFNNLTTPTDVEVMALIDSAFADVYPRMGVVPAVLQPAARRVVAIRAAALVELTYYPEASVTGWSAYDKLQEWFDTALSVLVEQKADIGNDGSKGELGPQDDATNGRNFIVTLDRAAARRR